MPDDPACVCAETSARNCPVHAPRHFPEYEHLRALALNYWRQSLPYRDDPDAEAAHAALREALK